MPIHASPPPPPEKKTHVIIIIMIIIQKQIKALCLLHVLIVYLFFYSVDAVVVVVVITYFIVQTWIFFTQKIRSLSSRKPCGRVLRTQKLRYLPLRTQSCQWFSFKSLEFVRVY